MNRKLAVISLLTIAAFLLTGCSGEDGAVGPEGDKGDPGSPQPIKVLIAGANNASSIRVMVTEATRMELFPIGTEIDYMSVSATTPDLATLNEYDAILLHSNSGYYEPAAFGDILADYVDGGGGLVITQFSFSTSWALGGEIMTAGYCPFQVDDSADLSGDRIIDDDSISFPIHPIFNGTDITDISFWSNINFSTPTLDAGATLVAADTEGGNAIAVNTDGNIVAMNHYALQLNETYFYASKIMANACLFVAGAY
ncbi:MAG: hypothetical protein GF417_08395 [Candidatus Latescibacteria bacterium]|nr:hypothetical protein [bacterium]MBD3424441.1 hypothetical protein [Candidatus Latescibacterota bacterium]